MKKTEKDEKRGADTAKQKKSAYKLIAVIALTVLFAAVYFSLISYEAENGFKNSIVMQVYAYTDALLVAAYLILNGGLSKDIPTLEMFDESVPREKAERTIEGIKSRKKLAKPLMFLIIPLTFTLFADVIFLFWGDLFAEILGGLISLIK